MALALRPISVQARSDVRSPRSWLFVFLVGLPVNVPVNSGQGASPLITVPTFRGRIVRPWSGLRHNRRVPNTRIPASLLDHALATHTDVGIDRRVAGNPYYRPAAIAVRRTPDPANVHAKIAELGRRF